jgi:hypothetical protein
MKRRLLAAMRRAKKKSLDSEGDMRPAAAAGHAATADAEVDMMAAVSQAMPGWGLAEGAGVQNVGTGADNGGRRRVERAGFGAAANAEAGA